MANKIKLSRILKAISPDRTSADFTEFDKEVAKLKDNLKEKITIKTLDDVTNELVKFKKKLSLDPILNAVEGIKKSFDKQSQELFDEIESKTLELSQADKARVEDLNLEISDLQTQLSSLEVRRKDDLERIKASIPSLTDIEDRVDGFILEISSRVDALEEEERTEKDWQAEIDKVQRDLMSKLDHVRGGNMNRNIAIGGNSSVLSRYTDINLKAGTNVTISYTNNNTTKFTDVTFSASGGGGSVIGTTRSINNISTSQTAGATSLTDYVYICTAGVKLTLPTAAGNSNLYTIKNTSTSSVLVATTGAETIDAAATALLQVQYTAVDLISDSTNWQVT